MHLHKNLVLRLSLLMFGCLLLIERSNSQIVPSNYNQPCLHASQCNNLAGLYCIPTSPTGQLRCGCPTNGTIFDAAQGRCVGKVGYPCIYQGNHTYCPETAHCSHQDPHHPDLYYYESRCFCDVNYFANKQGKCILASKFGDSCSAGNKKCDEVSGLKCIDEKCVCEFGSDEQYFDVRKGKCLSYVGKKCSDYYSCVENARCDGISSPRRARTQGGIKETGGGGIGGRRINNEITINNNNRNIDAKNPVTVPSIGNCICEYGFSPTKNGRCLPAYRQTCSDTQICNLEDDLECQDGSCNCRSPLHQHYDHLKKKCMSLIGAKCNLNEGISCIANATCVDGICTCIKGFSKTPFRKCLLDNQETCENGECNLYNGLTCKSNNKKCSCVDNSLVYNANSQACVSQVGSPCGKIGHVGDYGKESFFISCEPLAICKQEPGGDSTTAFCRLQKDFI